MLAAAFIVVVLTMAFMAIAGRRVIPTSRALAVILGAAFVPALGVVIAALLLWTAPDAPPPNDAPAMLFVALASLSMWALPVSFAASVACVLRCRRKSAL
jgi:hypothetical protein